MVCRLLGVQTGRFTSKRSNLIEIKREQGLADYGAYYDLMLHSAGIYHYSSAEVRKRILLAYAGDNFEIVKQCKRFGV